MAKIKISQMTPAATLDGSEKIPIVQGGLNKYATPDLIKTYYAYFYPSVNAYTDLPAANLHANEIYLVLTSTGVWLVNRKDAGMYYSNGVSWSRLGDVPTYFDSANFQIYDNLDNTKVVKFGTSLVSNNTTVTLTVPNTSGTIALTSNLSSYLPLAGGTLTGNLLFSADNTLDIGASNATRPRTGYFGTSVRSPLFEGNSYPYETLTLTSTHHSSKGSILFGTLGTFDEAYGQLRVGDNSNSGLFFNGQGQFHARRQDANATIRIVTCGNNTVSNYLAFDKSRGTFAAPTGIKAGDIIGSIVAVANDGVGAGMYHGAQMYMKALADWDATHHDNYFEFYTIPTNSTTQTLTLTLKDGKAEVSELIIRRGTGSNRDASITNSSTADNIARISIYPTTGPDTYSSLNIIPKGNGYSGVLKSELAIWNTDRVNDPFNTEDIAIQGNGSNGFGICSYYAGTGTIRPIWINATGTGTKNTSNLFCNIDGNVGLYGITSPTARLHLPAGTATASTSALKFTPATSVLLTAPEVGAFEPVGDNISYTINTGTARKQLVMTDGTLLISGRIPVASTGGRVVDFAGLTYSDTTGLATTKDLTTNMSGSGNRMVQASATGVLSAPTSVITGKLADATAIALLIDNANWTLGLYTGTAITGTYEGQYYKDDNYFYTAYSDNDWLRIPRA